jgi:signal transduction histidine kinase
VTTGPNDTSFRTGASVAVRAPRRRFRSLASRLVALGIGQMMLLACTATVIFFAEGPHGPANAEDKLTPATIAKLERLVDAPSALSDALDELHGQRIEVSLYDESRQLIASNVDPPLAIPARPPHRPHRPPPDSPGSERATGHDHDTPGGRSPDARPDPAEPRPPPESRPESRPDLGNPRRPPAPRSDQADPRQALEPRSDPGSPGPPPDLGEPRGRRFAPRRFLVMPFHPDGMRGLLIARGVHGGPPGLTGPLLVLVGGFVILVIGALITARWIVRPIERLSRTARALGSGDLKARSQLDRSDEIGELGHRFDEMADRIASLLATEKELLANVAHELRTPLTRIGVALDLASEGDAEAARASLAEIAVDVSELETIVDDILTAMRFELAPGRGAAQLPLRRAVVPPAEIAAAAADRLRARHPDRPLAVTTDDGAPAIHVDPVLFRRVIDNLLENAHKYTPDADAPIELSVTRDGPDGLGAVFEVRDRGIGIPSDDLPRIFTAFFRGERSRSRETGGVGLGLTLARRIVEAHDGAIEVTSTPNVGTSVRVSIPAALRDSRSDPARGRAPS